VRRGPQPLERRRVLADSRRYRAPHWDEPFAQKERYCALQLPKPQRCSRVRNSGGGRARTRTGAIVHLASLPAEGPTGTFQDRYGNVPWQITTSRQLMPLTRKPALGHQQNRRLRSAATPVTDPPWARAETFSACAATRNDPALPTRVVRSRRPIRGSRQIAGTSPAIWRAHRRRPDYRPGVVVSFLGR